MLLEKLKLIYNDIQSQTIWKLDTNQNVFRILPNLDLDWTWLSRGSPAGGKVIIKVTNYLNL